MKVTLKGSRRPPHTTATQWMPWTASKPFVENTRAVLVHRPKHVTTHNLGMGRKSHISVSAWCGNVATGTKKFTFLDAPADGLLVCARCEEKALAAGLPTSSELAGRHVHLGRVVPERTCCAPTLEKDRG